MCQSSSLHDLSHLVSTLGGQFHESCFPDGAREAQRGETTCLITHSWDLAKPGLNSLCLILTKCPQFLSECGGGPAAQLSGAGPLEPQGGMGQGHHVGRVPWGLVTCGAFP